MLKFVSIIAGIACVSAVLYCFSLADNIDKRFSGRRWSIPSKVFSDLTVLYPGQRINSTFFYEKLRRLGYRQVQHAPMRPGDMKIDESSAELFLHDLIVPSHSRPGFRVRIGLNNGQITSVENLEDGVPVHLLELEPEELMLFYGPEQEQREVVSLERVPQHLIYAVLSAEDRRFYRHYGLDPVGILRAVYLNLRHGAIVAGGSTITQQLAKCYFLTPKRTLSRKLKELFIAITIEAMYAKDEILELYLNEIYFGQKGTVSIHGIAEAASFYFAKPVSELSLAEAAALAGLIKAPNRYSPYASTMRCQQRRNAVLQSMYANNWITTAELQAALTASIQAAGYTVYAKKAPYFIDYLSEQLKTLYSPEVLSTLGLAIYTTLDTQVQMAAEWALERGLARLEKSYPTLHKREADKRLQGAVVVLQPRSGAILALVGGRSYRVSQFNRITQARRQPGSAFKPFVYVNGLDAFTPAALLSNEPRSYAQYGEPWEPQNFAPVDAEQVTLRNALAQSINLPTVDLAMKVGLDRLVSTASAFGFSTPLKPYPSLALGAFEVIPLELARAYCAFAADGVLPYPLSLKDVVDENGTVLERRHMDLERITTPAKAFLMSSLLRSVVTDGTARSLKKRNISFPVAGKTGTTNDYRDAWFVGYTPDILALVWVGFDNGSSIHSSGASAALPIWAELINSIPQYLTGNWFKLPPGVVQKMLCLESGQLFLDKACPKALQEYCLVENAPAEDCSMHRKEGAVKRFFKGINDFFKKF